MKQVWEDRKGFSVELKEAVATTRYHALLLIPVIERSEIVIGYIER
jgi:hypothetical protein